MNIDLSGKTVIVTGATGGIGLAIAIWDEFDQWLTAVVISSAQTCEPLLSHWQQAPQARQCHPLRTEEHLIPHMVAAGPVTKPKDRKSFQHKS